LLLLKPYLFLRSHVGNVLVPGWKQQACMHCLISFRS